MIGVHTPEYAFEHVAGNVAAGAKRIGITYPVALDNDYTTWNAFSNDSWPADYLIDSTGIIRHVSIGEGDYTGTEKLIRQLLAAAKPGAALPKQHARSPTPRPILGADRPRPTWGRPARTATRAPRRWVWARTSSRSRRLAPERRIRAVRHLDDRRRRSHRRPGRPNTAELPGARTSTWTSAAPARSRRRSNGATKTFKVSGAPNIYTGGESEIR